jgi:hypothetical protein
MNVFIKAGNDNRDVSIGGRGRSDSGYARLNTDNGGDSDVAVVVRAEVTGERHRDGRPRQTCHECGYKWAEGHYVNTHRGVETEGHQSVGENVWVDGDDKLRACPKCQAPRQGVDTRKSHFTVELPDQTDPQFCEVHIRPHNAALADLARMGAALCSLKGTLEIVEGVETGNEDLIGHGEQAINFARETFASMDERLKGAEYGNVYLPGGVSLAKALTCVEIVKRIAENKGDGPN